LYLNLFEQPVKTEFFRKLLLKFWSLSQGYVIVVLLRESMPNIVQTQGVLILWIVHLNAMITTQLNHYRFFD